MKLFQDRYKLFLTSDKINSLAYDISNRLVSILSVNTNRPVVFVVLLDGAVNFYIDIINRLPFYENIHTHYVKVKSYHEDGVQSKIHITGDAGLFDYNNPLYVVFDELCDSSRTLTHFIEYLEVGVRKGNVITVTLLNRLIEGKTYRPDIVGMDVDTDDWFIGYGMNGESNKYRSLKDIYTVIK